MSEAIQEFFEREISAAILKQRSALSDCHLMLETLRDRFIPAAVEAFAVEIQEQRKLAGLWA